MDGSHPVDRPRSVKLSLPYLISEKWQLEQLALTGELPSRRWMHEEWLPEVPPELRPRAAKLWTALRERGGDEDEMPVPELRRPPNSLADILKAYERMLSKEALYAAQQQRAHRMRQSKERAESERFQAEMRSWVEAHGSRRLRLALDRDYKVTGAYVAERLEQELPGFTADTTKQAIWEERASPSLKALEHEEEALSAAATLEGEHEIQIVWLTQGPRDWPYITPEEAICVSGYLGRYYLYRSVDERTSSDNIPF